MIHVRKLTFNPLQENTYLVYAEAGADCIIIDPGCYTKEEQNTLHSLIQEHNLKPWLCLNTHSHVDHVLGNDFVCNKYRIPLWIFEKDLETLLSVKVYAPHWGFAQYTERYPDRLIKAGEKIEATFGTIDVVPAPGHSPGHVLYILHPAKVVLGGDVLFRGSIGRYDLPGGSYPQLIQSIHTQLLSLDDEYIVYPGHGMATTIGEERRGNPFLNT